MRHVIAVSLGLLAALLAAPTASAAIFPVNSDQDLSDANPGDTNCDNGAGLCTLRGAIEEANALGGPDQVNLPPGTYTLGVQGQLTVSSGITIEGTGTASNTTIAQAPPGRVFEVTASSSLDLRDATVRDGFLANDGGGILTQGSLTLRRVVMTNNQANNERGGAIAVLSPTGGTTILDSVIGAPGGAAIDNQAGGPGATQAFGGGIYHDGGTLTIRRTTIADNHVDSVGAGVGTTSVADGGGLYSNAGTVVVEDSAIESNVTNSENGQFGGARGAGLSNNDGQLTVRRSTIADNQATSDGTVSAGIGGISNGDVGVIEDSTVSGNSSSTTSGNGISHTGSPGETLTLRRSTVEGNQAGGVSAGEPLVLENSTVSGNGTGIGVSTNADVTVRSSTIAGHGGVGIQAVGAISVTVTGSILDENSPNCQTFPSATIVSGGGNVENGDDCGFAAAGDKPNMNPLLGPLQGNGGPTQTQAIAADSPARDAVTSGCPPPATDQRGVARPQGPACDSGAFEFAVASPQPPPPPPPPPPGPPSATLELSLYGKGKQNPKKLTVDVGCGGVACSVDLEGKARIPTRAALAAKAKKLKLKPKSVDLAAGVTETVRLKFRKHRKTVKKIKALLEQGGRKARKAKVVVNATATAGSEAETAKQKIKLKR